MGYPLAGCVVHLGLPGVPVVHAYHYLPLAQIVRSEVVAVGGRERRVGGEQDAAAEGGRTIILTFIHVEEV